MKKPYIVCHMMTSLDGRIDCAMTEQLPGVQEYYQILEALQAPTTVSGRVTAQLEMALPGDFQAKDSTPVGKEAFSRKTDAPGYEVVADTHGKLLWPDAGQEEKPLLILTSEQVPQEYLTYLDGRNISWLATGKNGSIWPVLRKSWRQSLGWSAWPLWAAPPSTPAFWMPVCWTRSASSSALVSTAGMVCQRCSTACPWPTR